MENTGRQGRKPDWIVKTVTDTNKVDENGKPESRWRELGVAFNNERSQTITILLDALPAGDKPKLVLTKPKEAEQPKQAAISPTYGFKRPY